MKVAQMSWVRREFVYFLFCGLAGFVVLPGILVFVGTWLMHHGTWFPEVWPSSFLEGYLAFFSLMWLRIQRGHLLMPLAEILVCFLVPYTLFQLARWSIRGIRSVRVRGRSGQLVGYFNAIMVADAKYSALSLLTRRRSERSRIWR